MANDLMTGNEVGTSNFRKRRVISSGLGQALAGNRISDLLSSSGFKDMIKDRPMRIKPNPLAPGAPVDSGISDHRMRPEPAVVTDRGLISRLGSDRTKPERKPRILPGVILRQ
jgi:hypothetical protein